MNTPHLVAVWLLALTSGSDVACPALPTSPTTSVSTAPVLTAVGGLGEFSWAQVVTLAGALIAAGGVVLTIRVNATRARRESLATLYADALGAVAEYLEGPYRILRKDGEASTRLVITSKLSDVKTAIDHNQALLRLHCDVGVADAYDDFVLVAKQEAGQQMHDAWEAPPVTTDAGMNLNVALPRENSSAARDRLVEVMQASLNRRWYKPNSKQNYKNAVTAMEKAKSLDGEP